MAKNDIWHHVGQGALMWVSGLISSFIVLLPATIIGASASMANFSDISSITTLAGISIIYILLAIPASWFFRSIIFESGKRLFKMK